MQLGGGLGAEEALRWEREGGNDARTVLHESSQNSFLKLKKKRMNAP